MGIKVETTCLNCGKQETKYNTAGKYCSNKCQHDYQHKQRVISWVNGDYNVRSHTIKRHLTESIGDFCFVCGIVDWQDKKLDLEVDHIDGDPFNNKLRNLRLICPNCHSQTPTYKAKNKGNGRKLGKRP